MMSVGRLVMTLIVMIFTIAHGCGIVAAECWPARYQGAMNEDRLNAIAADYKGNIIAVGRSWRSNASKIDMCTVKYNPDGTRQWVQIYQGLNEFASEAQINEVRREHRRITHSEHHWLYDSADAVTTDDTGNIYVSGRSEGLLRYGATCHMAAVIKYSPNGKRLWVGRYYHPNHSFISVDAIAIDREGNVYVAGSILNLMNRRSSPQLCLVRFNNDGRIAWARTYPYPRIPGNMYIDSSGDIQIVCEIHYGGDRNVDIIMRQLPQTESGFVFLNYTRDGKLKAQRKVDVRKGVFRGAFKADTQGNLYCRSIEHGFDQYLSKYDSNGMLVWSIPEGRLDIKWQAGSTIVYTCEYLLDSAIGVDTSGCVFEMLRNRWLLRIYNVNGLNIGEYLQPRNADTLKWSFLPTCATDDSKGNLFIGGCASGLAGDSSDFMTLKFPASR